MDKEPKSKVTFDGCYNFKKLKKEGLVEEKKKNLDETRHLWDHDDGC